MNNDQDIDNVLVQEISSQVKIVSDLLDGNVSEENHEKLLNAFHLMNGSARFLSNDNFVQHLNILEHFVLMTFQKKIKIDQDSIDILKEGLLHITKFLENDHKDGAIDFSVFENKLSLLSMILDVPEAEKALVLENKKELSVSGNIEEKIDFKKTNEIYDNPILNQTENSEHKKNEIIDSVVKVNISLLDKLMDLVGELVVNRNQMQQLSIELKHPTFLKLSNDLNTITTDLQSNIMITRMQPVGIVLSKFERLVRDLSNKQKKKISFKIIGQDTELDKSLLKLPQFAGAHFLI